LLVVIIRRFSMLTECWLLEKFCGVALPIKAAASAYEYFNLIPGAGAA